MRAAKKKGRLTMQQSMQDMLYEFQKNVIETSKPNYIYPLDTGTGKTIIALHHYLKYYYASRCNILIVAPAQKVKEGGWIREIKKVQEHYNLDYIEYSAISYEKLRNSDLKDKKNIDFLANTFVIFDECHYAKNYKSKRSKATLEVTKKAKGFVLLSATPSSNGWQDTANYFAMFEVFKTPSAFIKEHAIFKTEFYGGMRVKKIDGFKNEILLKRLFDNISAIPLKKEDCLDLPELIFENVSFKPSAEYKKILKDRVLGDIVYDTAPKRIAGLRQHSNIKDKLDYVKMLRESTEDNILIFYNFQSEYDALIEIINADYEVRGGSSNIPEKEEFTEVRNKTTLVQIQAGGTGIELQYNNLVVFFSPTWSYQDYEQALGRAYRNGQEKKVTVFKFVTKDTIEEDVYEALTSKKDFTKDMFLKRLGG